MFPRRVEPSSEEVLSIVIQRQSIIQLISTDSYTKPQLVDQLDVSRSTVDRALRELEQYGLMNKNDSQYTLNPYGRFIYQTCIYYHDVIKKSLELWDIRNDIHSSGQVPPNVLYDSEIFVPTESIPDLPAKKLFEMIESILSLHLVLPVLTYRIYDNLHQFVSDEDSSLELILPPEGIQSLRQFEDERCIEESTLITDATNIPPYGFGVYEDADRNKQMNIIIFSNNGVCGLIQNSSRMSTFWGEQKYENINYSSEGTDEIVEPAESSGNEISEISE